MSRKELCMMCAEYSFDTKCEHKKDCKLQAILTENAQLKCENRELKRKLNDLKSARSWDLYPDMMGK